MDMIKLISVNNDELKNEALNIYLKNDYYFSKISDNLPNISAVEEDIKAIPNGVQKNQKNYRLISFKKLYNSRCIARVFKKHFISGRNTRVLRMYCNALTIK